MSAKGIPKILIPVRHLVAPGLRRLAIGLVVFLLLFGNATADEGLDSETKPLSEGPVQKMMPVSVRESISTAGVDVFLEPPDLTQVLEEDQALLEQESVRRIGILRSLPAPVTFSARQTSEGKWVDLRDGGSVWTLTILSAEAEAIRIHIEEVHLPEGTLLFVYDTFDPQESYGPYDVGDLRGRTEFWTESVFTCKVTLECYVPSGFDANEVKFQVQEIAHVYVKFLDLIPKVGDCHNDVTCHSGWATEANGVAGLGTIGGTAGVLWCTGCLLNDYDSETFEDYFLTANHCLSGYDTVLGTQAEADTIEYYWFYQTPSCDGTPPNPATVPRTGGGADLISIQTRINGSEHAFLRIRNVTPGGVTYEGWTTGTPGISDTLTGIHHPDGSFKRISFGTLDDSSTNFWDVQWYSGVTEGGSSGSPLFDADHRVIGQLRGGASSCANPTGIDDYGRFNTTYAAIQRWLQVGGTIHVDSTYVGEELGTPSKPFNTVGEANNFAWDGVRIKIKAGSYPETLVFSKELTVLAAGGTVTIGQ